MYQCIPPFSRLTVDRHSSQGYFRKNEEIEQHFLHFDNNGSGFLYSRCSDAIDR